MTAHRINIFALGLMMGLALAGCAGAPEQVLSYQAKPMQADVDGWYHYRTYWFQGELTDGQPHGVGRCRTAIAQGSYLPPPEQWEETPCTFHHGERIDARHAELAEARQADYGGWRRQQLADEQRRRAEDAEEAALRRRQAERSAHATQAAIIGALSDMNTRLAAANQQMARADQQTIQNIAQARAYTTDQQAKFAQTTTEGQPPTTPVAASHSPASIASSASSPSVPQRHSFTERYECRSGPFIETEVASRADVERCLTDIRTRAGSGDDPLMVRAIAGYRNVEPRSTQLGDIGSIQCESKPSAEATPKGMRNVTYWNCRAEIRYLFQASGRYEGSPPSTSGSATIQR